MPTAFDVGCAWERAEVAEHSVAPATRLMVVACASFMHGPLGTIAIGGLLAYAGPESTEWMLGLRQKEGWQGRTIGRVLPAEEGVY